METTDKDWGRIYPNVITWITNAKDDKEAGYHILTWVRFWREGLEYQIPMRMDVKGVKSLKEGSRYDEQFHTKCIELIRYGRATGDFKEPIKFDDKHVITITYEDLKDGLKEKEDRQ